MKNPYSEYFGVSTVKRGDYYHPVVEFYESGQIAIYEVAYKMRETAIKIGIRLGAETMESLKLPGDIN